MAKSQLYLAVGEEAARGTKEVTTLGFVPVLNSGIPKFEPDEKARDEHRGEDSQKGDTLMTRMSRKWSGSFEIPLFTEAGTTVGMIGTLLKHFFGYVASAENATTGQFAHMLSRPSDPFATANLGAKGLTFNRNINEGATMKNWPYVGGRIKSLTLESEPGGGVKMTIETFGQFRDTVTAEIGSPVWPAENLRCDYNNLTIREGTTVTRTGTAPDYTDISSDGNIIKPDKWSLKLENGFEDKLRHSGLDYPDKTRVDGKITAQLDMTLDWEDPASGFSSVDDYNAWVAAAGETNFLLTFDTGTQAGTGDNHSVIIDIPRAHRLGGDQDYDLAKDPMVNLSYKALMDLTTAQYLIGMLLKNTATAV